MKKFLRVKNDGAAISLYPIYFIKSFCHTDNQISFISGAQIRDTDIDNFSITGIAARNNLTNRTVILNRESVGRSYTIAEYRCIETGGPDSINVVAHEMTDTYLIIKFSKSNTTPKIYLKIYYTEDWSQSTEDISDNLIFPVEGEIEKILINNDQDMIMQLNFDGNKYIYPNPPITSEISVEVEIVRNE